MSKEEKQKINLQEDVELEEQEPEEEETIINEIEIIKLIMKAKDLEKQKKFNEAADLYSEVCQARAKIYGEESYEFADIVLLYGECLLQHLQSKETILEKFNKVIEKKIKKDKGEDEEEEGEIDDEQEIWDIVFGSFESARKIYFNAYEKKLYPLDEKSICKKICRVHQRIAEFHLENDNFMEGIDEYQKALKFAFDQTDQADM